MEPIELAVRHLNARVWRLPIIKWACLCFALLLAAGCSLDMSLESLTSSATSLNWNKESLKAGDLEAHWQPQEAEKTKQQELLYFKGENCDTPILPTYTLGPKETDHIPNFTKESGVKYTYRVFTMDNTGVVTPSVCSPPITYVDSFSVESLSQSIINESNTPAAAFKGLCSLGSSIQVSTVDVASVASFTCTSEDWSRNLDLSSLPGNFVGDLIFTVSTAGFTAKEYRLAITKDSIPPTLALNTPTTITSLNQGSYPISGSCSEEGATVDLVIGALQTSTLCTGGGFSTTLDVNSLTGNTVVITANLKDAVLNSISKFVITDRFVAPPIVTSVAINNGNATTNNLAVTLNSIVSGAAQIYVTNTPSCIAGGTWATYAASKAWTLQTANANNTVYVKFRDTYGNETACLSDDILHDSINPTITLDSPLADAYVNSSNVTAFMVSGTCSENGRSITFAGPGSFAATTSCVGTSYSAILNLTTLSQGDFQLTASLTDLAGNSGSTTSPTYHKDTVAPTGSILINNDAPATASLAVTLNLTQNEPGQMYITKTPGCTANGTWEAFASTRAWNLTTANATNTVYAKFKDVAGNESACYSDSIVHTSTLPSLSLASPSAGTYISLSNVGNFTISGACSEEGRAVTIATTGINTTATCTSGAWSKNLNLSSLAQGTVTFTIDHSSALGLNAPQVIQSFTKDTIAPTADTFVINNNDSYTASLSATLSMAATGATEMYVTNAALCLSGGVWEPVAATKSWTLPNANNTNTVYFKVRDAAGNESNCISDSIIHDATIPTLTFTSPAANSYMNAYTTAAYKISGACSENGRSVDLTITGQPGITRSATCYSGAWSMIVNFSALADNTVTPYEFVVTHSRPSGNQTSAKSYYFKDVVLPFGVTITGAPTGTNAVSTLNITISGTDIVQYRYFIVPPGGTDQCTNLILYTGPDIDVATKITDSLSAQGVYKVCVVGQDIAGNWSSWSMEASWTRDTTPPTALLANYPVGVSTSTALNVTVSGTNVTQYKKAVISSGTCSTASYSSAIPVATRITDNISALPNGNLTLCVLGGGTSGIFQDPTSATNVSWTQDAISTLSISSSTMNRLAEGSSSNIILSLSPAKTYDVVAAYAVGGDAVNPTNHNLVNGTLITIPAGTSTVSIPVNFPYNATADGEKLLNFSLVTTDQPTKVMLGTSYQAQYFISDNEKNLTIASFSTGRNHACAIMSNSVLRCWGINYYGQVGDGTSILKETGVTISSGTSFQSVAVGQEHTCAVTTTGALYCWGRNLNSTVGDGTTTARYTPVLVDSGTTYSKVVAGDYHSCGLTTSNTIKCWGLNSYGQLGQGTTTTQTTPALTDGTNTYKFLAAGSQSTCAITASDKLRCWGRNASSQLGDGTTVAKNIPTDIDSGNSYQSVSIGSGHACGITTFGVLKCWGANVAGQLGDNSLTARTSPVIINAGTQYISVSTNDDGTSDTTQGTTCGITADNTLHCWGYNGHLAVGDGTLINKIIPTVADSGTSYSQVGVSGGHSCGVTITGALKCWGLLGYDPSRSIYLYGGGVEHSLVISSMSQILKDWQFNSLATFGNYASAINSQTCGLISGKLYCWGTTPSNSAFGDGSTGQVFRASPVMLDPAATYIYLPPKKDIGGCAVDDSNKIKCWGMNNYGQLGSAAAVGAKALVPTIADSGSYSQVINFGGVTCGITTGGALKCAGLNTNGQIGIGNNTNQTSFVTVDSGVIYTAVDIGAGHVCGITNTGVLKCWGSNSVGQLGIGSYTDSNLPVVVDSGVTYIKLALATQSTCAITSANKLKCWGSNSDANLGDLTFTNKNLPTAIDSGNTYKEVSMSYANTCGVMSSGSLKCWGNYKGFSGLYSDNGSTSLQNGPTLTDSGTTYTKVYLGYYSTCGLTTGGIYKCIGIGTGGSFGVVDPGHTLGSGSADDYLPTYIHKGLNY